MNIQGVYAEVIAQTGWQQGSGKHLLVYGAVPRRESARAVPTSTPTSVPAAGPVGGPTSVAGTRTTSCRALGRNFGLAGADAEQCTGGLMSGYCSTESPATGTTPWAPQPRTPVGAVERAAGDRPRRAPSPPEKITVDAASSTIRTVTLQSISRRTGVNGVAALELTDPSLGTTDWLELRTPNGRDSSLTSPRRIPSRWGCWCAAPPPVNAG